MEHIYDFPRKLVGHAVQKGRHVTLGPLGFPQGQVTVTIRYQQPQTTLKLAPVQINCTQGRCFSGAAETNLL